MQVAEFVECYEKHAEALTRFAVTLVGPADADDVVSEAVVSILSGLPNEVADMRSYLYRSVANSSRKHWRSIGRRTRRERNAAALEVVEAAWADTDVAKALLGLSPQQRGVVHLTYWEDLTPGMVAERLGVSDGTVRRQLARARKRLREDFHDEHQ